MIARTLPRDDYAGGVSGQVHALAVALTRRGHDVTVYALTPPPAAAPYQWHRVRSDGMTGGRLGVLYLFPLWVARHGFDGYDLVHAHGDDHFLRTRRPVIRTFYGSSRAEARHSTRLRHRLYHLSMSIVERVSERRATEVVVISAATGRYLSRASTHIPCGYDPATFSPGRKSGPPSILFVGDLGTRKRAELLLDVFARVVKPAVPDAELWMVTSERLEAPGVRWLGRLSTADLVDRYRRASVFCLPSRYEGFGVPYVEAMACGTPVVATPNGGAEEILEGGHHGRLVDPGALGEALVELLSSDERRQQFAERGLLRAKDYDIGLIAQRYERIYRDALTAR